MNIKLINIILLAFLFTSCIATKNNNYSFNKKYAATQVKNDIVLLKKILEANHPSLYWYTSKDSIDYFFSNTLATITDSLTEIQAKNKIASILSHIKCGHTSVRFSKQFTALAEKNKYPQFPLSIKTWKDSMVVLGRYNVEDSVLKRGTIVTAINGKNPKQLLDSMFQFISTDGNSNNFKSQILSNNFPAWYRSVFGVDSVYQIKYIDSMNIERLTTLKSYSPKKDTTKRAKKTDLTNAKKAIKKPSKKEQRLAKILSYRSMNIDTSISTAYIKLSTFSNGELRRFFRKSFREIKEKNIQNLVIDIRENGGGSVAKSVLLLKYLKDKPFKIADTISAKSRNFEYKNHIKNWLKYWLMMRFTTVKETENPIHQRFYENNYIQPKASKQFKGNLYIVQGGYTFSAATILSSFLKGQKNVTIVGEESGGGYYGNSAMFIPNIVLPNTKLMVRLPMFRYVMDKNRPKGNGIIPDVEIQPSSDAIKKGVDIKLITIKNLIANYQDSSQTKIISK